MKFDGKHSNVFNFMADKYTFRFNVVNGFYEFQKKKKSWVKKDKWKKYDDRQKNTMVMELLQNSLEIPTDKFNTFIESEDFSPDFNPFLEYFDGIRLKKVEKGWIKKLAATVKTDEPDEFAMILERFLIGVVDCLLNPDTVNDVCLVFQSKQGIGKSRWMRSILPKQFQSEYLYEGNIDTRKGDHTQYLSQYWFIHLDELETLKSNDISAIKSYITRQRISVRKAYGRYKMNFVRRASFLGSVNEDKFLSDTTGNRRWLVFKARDINYMHGIDPDKVWAEVYKKYSKGKRYWFDIEEIKKINQRNERFRSMSLEEELLLRYFMFNKKKGTGEMLSTSEVIQKVIINVPSFNHKMRGFVMGKALAKHAKYSKMRGGVQHYYLEYLGKEEFVETPSPKVSGDNGKTISEEDDLPF